MRILFVHNRYKQSTGGEDSAVEAEIKLLESNGHQVSLLLFDNATIGNGVINQVKAGITAIYNVNSKKKLQEVIQLFSPDIIHIHNLFFEASPSVLYAAKESGIPVILTVHNYRLLCVNALLLRNGKVCEDCVQSVFPWKGIIRKCYHNSIADSALVGLITTTHKLRSTWSTKIDRFVTPSSFIRSKLLNSSLSITDPDKIVVKGNFIDDPEDAPPSERKDFFLFVGRLSAEKGIHFLLSSFAKWPHLKILIVGDGPDKDELLKQYSQYPNISFEGKKGKNEVLALMKQAKALIFPSIWYEGLPLTIVEAFASGLPVIATRLGAMQEMISHKINGFLFEKEDPDSLKSAIQEINSMVQQGNYALYNGARNIFMEHYHADVCYKKIMDIYTAAIQERRIKQVSKTNSF
ncbi:MAG: glycosyltransferase family 4 protein [Chitinophagaceae bacterium]